MTDDRIMHTRIEADTFDRAWAQMLADIPPEGKGSSFTLVAKDQKGLPGVWDVVFGSQRVKLFSDE